MSDPVTFGSEDVGGIDLSGLSDETKAAIGAIADSHGDDSPTDADIDSLVAELQALKAEADSRTAWRKLGVFAARTAARFAGLPV